METATVKSSRKPPISRRNNRLKEYRKRAGLTQKQLAERLNVKQANISKAETEGVGLAADTWFRLSHLFNVDPRILSGWEPPEEDQPIIPPIV